MDVEQGHAVSGDHREESTTVRDALRSPAVGRDAGDLAAGGMVLAETDPATGGGPVGDALMERTVSEAAQRPTRGIHDPEVGEPLRGPAR